MAWTRPPRRQGPTKVAQGESRVVDVFQDILADDAIDGSRIERQPVVDRPMNGDSLAQALALCILPRAFEEIEVHVEGEDTTLLAHPACQLECEHPRAAAKIDHTLPGLDRRGLEQGLHAGMPAEHLLIGFDLLGVRVIASPALWA